MSEPTPISLSFSNSFTSQMAICLCGDVFQEHGKAEIVAEKWQAWNAEHKDCQEQKREGSKVFWLSFCDAELPEGSQFLGACLIEVTAAEADEAAIDVMLRFPFARPHAEWIAAAVKKSHELKCNPGWEVATMEVPPDHPMLAHYTLGVLMDRATVARIDDEIGAALSSSKETPT